MGRPAALALLFVGLLGALVHAQDDFDLSEALDDGKKTTAAPKKPSGGGDFDLSEAVDTGGNPDPAPPKQPEPRPNPKPKQPGASDGFSDSDLMDVAGGEGGRGGPGGSSPRNEGEGQEDQPQGVVPGIVGAVVVAVAGAISSFIAYQKKKLCFKENPEQSEVNLESCRTTNAEPPVQQTLLEK
ncbi:PREDICTED: CD99 antigen [Chinchilla lanigera]|uniref:CD99 antigen n=1 Tax=Chinchilla lanigera TaxID=34839 RepID=UPI0006967726|nr:PREDICTED: CD99 antigen [Chinchilla lanigera]